MIKIELTFQSIAEAATFLGVTPIEAPEVKAEPAEKKERKPRTSKKIDPGDMDPADMLKPQVEDNDVAGILTVGPAEPEDDFEVAEEPVSDITISDIRKLANEKSKAKEGNKDKITDILRAMKLPGLSALPESKYGEFYKKLQAL